MRLWRVIRHNLKIIRCRVLHRKHWRVMTEAFGITVCIKCWVIPQARTMTPMYYVRYKKLNVPMSKPEI